MKKPWGGRFFEGTDTVVEDFTSSISFDVRLAPHDIAGSIAHVRTLERAGILTSEEAASLCRELESIKSEIEAGTFEIKRSLEDIHMNIEAALAERLGEVGKKLHTARSRNDQVACDTRLFAKDEAEKARDSLIKLKGAILKRAEEEIGAIMPGYTHLQRAQPVLLSHWLLAYWEMFNRDGGRFSRAMESADVSPLGSGALAGVPYLLDREYTKELLGFSQISRNSIDAVSDRDFVLEYLFAASLLMVHLSRLAEELVIFSTAEFGFVSLPDEYATGSSIMPQKKNPDVPELVRGKSGRVFGSLVALLTVMKGLPLAYMRDMQEDKEALFDVVDTVSGCLAVMTGLMERVSFNHDRMSEASRGSFITATDVADYLVKKGVSFRDAHEIVGGIVKKVEGEGRDIGDLSRDEWRGASPLFGDDIVDAVTSEHSVSSRAVLGGTSRDRVCEAIRICAAIDERERKKK